MIEKNQLFAFHLECDFIKQSDVCTVLHCIADSSEIHCQFLIGHVPWLQYKARTADIEFICCQRPLIMTVSTVFGNVCDYY